MARFIESERRNRYFELIGRRTQSAEVANPWNAGFDPHRAAIHHRNAGSFEEACWLTFLSVHFGRHRRAEWRYVRDVYGRLGDGLWDWASVSLGVHAFREWLNDSQDALCSGVGPRGFGNHRKYQSLDAWSPSGTGAAVEGYVASVCAAGTHRDFLAARRGESPEATFDRTYRALRTIPSFGRLAAFDYVNHARNLGLSIAVPGMAYLQGASGPVKGARLLFAGSATARMGIEHLESLLAELERYVDVGYDVLEDSLCNWQKNPQSFTRFRG